MCVVCTALLGRLNGVIDIITEPISAEKSTLIQDSTAEPSTSPHSKKMKINESDSNYDDIFELPPGNTRV